jgi:polyhydroxyalkanoate synthesis regulator protein
MRRLAEPILIKRYAGTRLYDTNGLRYLTLANLQNWRKRRVPFVVREAETGRDITRLILTSNPPT